MADRLAIIQSEESIREFQAIIDACKDVVSNFKDVEKGAKAVNKALNSGKPREYANAIRDLASVTQQFANIERTLAASMARTASLEAQQARAARDQAAARRDNAAAAREEARVRDQATRQAEREARANSQSTSAFKNLQREMQAVRQKARDYKAEIFNLKRALADGSITQAEYNRRLAEFSRNARTSTREAITLQREIRRINQDTIPSDQRGGALSGRVTDIIKGITGAGAINKIVDSMTSIATDGYETIKILNAQNLALKSVFDTQAQISFQKEYLIDLTDKYGLELVSTTEAYTKYSAAVKGTYLEGEKARKIYDSFSGASAKLGLSAEQNTGIFRALEQMISKGKIQAEELRGQLGDRMAGAFRLFADGMGVSTAQLDKMLKDGEVVADTVLPKVAERLAKVYNLDTAERIDTIAASQNRLKNEWTSFLDDIAGNKENIDLLTGGIEALSYGVQFLLDILIKDGAAGREILTGLIDVISSLLEVLAAVGGVSDTTSTKMEKLQATLTYISADVNILASAIKYLTSVVSNFFSTMFEEDGWDKFNRKMEKSADSLINAYETWDKKTSDADKLFTGLTANERAIRQREEETKRYTKNWEDAKAAKAAYFNYKGKYFSTATGRNTGKSLDDYIDVGDRLERKVKVKPTVLPDKTKKPKAASLSAAQKDQMNILQAERDTAIAYLTQKQNEGLINEQQFQEKRIAIIKDYAAKVTSYLKGQNAKEKQVSASVMLKASSEIKASLKDQADYFSKENEETYKKSQNLIERQAKDLEKNDYLTNTDRLNKQIELDNLALEQAEKFYNDQLDIANAFHQNTIEIERRRDEEIGKILDSRFDHYRALNEGLKKDLEKQTEFANTFSDLNYEEQRSLIIANKKLSISERERQLDILEKAHQIELNKNKIKELEALEKELKTRISIATVSGVVNPEDVQQLASVTSQKKGLENENVGLNDDIIKSISEKTLAIREAFTTGLKNLGFETLADNYTRMIDRLNGKTMEWKDYAILAATAVLDSLSKITDTQKEKRIAALDEELKASQATNDQELGFINNRLTWLNNLDEMTKEQQAERDKLEQEARGMKEQQLQREKLIATQKAKAEQRADANKALINGALAATTTLAQLGFPIGIIPAGLALGFGIAQSVAIMSKDPVPKYFKGRENGPAEWAETQDRYGRELITNNEGTIKSTGSDTGGKLTWLEKGDKVITASKTKALIKSLGRMPKVGENIYKNAAMKTMIAPVIINNQSKGDYSKAIEVEVAKQVEAATMKAFKMHSNPYIVKKKGFIIEYHGSKNPVILGTYDLKTLAETYYTEE